MPDVFDAAYDRLAGTRLRGDAPEARPVLDLSTWDRDSSSPVRWAASRLLPRLQTLAPVQRAARRSSLFSPKD